jgi:hypothetical protein
MWSPLAAASMLMPRTVLGGTCAAGNKDGTAFCFYPLAGKALV